MIFELIQNVEYCHAPECDCEAHPDIKGDLGEGYCSHECLEYTDELCYVD